MAAREQDDLPYHVDLSDAVADRRDTFTVDDANFDTLSNVQAILHASVDELYKDFNLLHIPVEGADDAVLATFRRQVEAKQAAYAILAPVVDAVDSAINLANLKHKER